MEKKQTLKIPALLTGWAIIVMALLAGIAYGGILQYYLRPGDEISKTLELKKNIGNFQLAIILMCMVAICDVVVSVFLYPVFKKTHVQISVLMSLLRLAYTILLGIGLILLFDILAAYKQDISIDILTQQTQKNLQYFNQVWSSGLILFGVHLLLLGWLCLKSTFVPKVWFVLLTLAGSCYVLTSSSEIMIPEYATYKGTVESILALPMAAGELGFGIWLLVKGRKVIVN